MCAAHKYWDIIFSKKKLKSKYVLTTHFDHIVMSFYLIVRNILTPTLCSEHRLNPCNIRIVHFSVDNFPDKLASAVNSVYVGCGKVRGIVTLFLPKLANGPASSCCVSSVAAHRVSCRLFSFGFLVAISHRLRRMRSWTCVTIAALPSLSEEHWIGDMAFVATYTSE